MNGPLSTLPDPLERPAGSVRETPDRVLVAARRYAAEGRESHVLWASHLQAHEDGDCPACTPDVVETAGDLAMQLEWVRKYDVILLALELVDETLSVRLIDAVARISDDEERKSRVKNARHALRYRREAHSVG